MTTDFKDIEPAPAPARRTLQRHNPQNAVSDAAMAEALGLRVNQLLDAEAARDADWPEWDTAFDALRLKE